MRVTMSRIVIQVTGEMDSGSGMARNICRIHRVRCLEMNLFKLQRGVLFLEKQQFVEDWLPKSCLF